jgi:hypothetical protein
MQPTQFTGHARTKTLPHLFTFQLIKSDESNHSNSSFMYQMFVDALLSELRHQHETGIAPIANTLKSILGI